MIRTLDAIAAYDLAHVQGREPVGTAILKGGDVSVRFSIKNNRLFQDGATEQLTVAEIVRPCRYIPRIAQIGPTDHPLLALKKLRIEDCCGCHRALSILFVRSSIGTS